MKKNLYSKNRCLLTCLIIGLISLLSTLTVSAASFSSSKPDYKPLERPELQLEKQPKEDVLSSPSFDELPPISNEEGERSLSSLESIFVKQFVFKGNKMISSEELSKLVEKFQNRNISAEELQEVKNKISLEYINRGYINSGAIIPDQEVPDGNIEIEIIEGQLIEINVTNKEGRLTTDYVKQRLIFSDNEILDINQLQEKLQLLQQNPLIKRINAELGPGIKLGEAILNVDVTQQDKEWEVGFSFNNHRSPSVGAERGEFSFIHRDVSTWGDEFSLQYGLTKGLKDYSLDYTFPLSYYYGTTLSLSAENSDSEVVEAPFNQLNVESEVKTLAASLKQPFYKKADTEVNLGLRIEKRESKTFLLDRPFSFSPGVNNGESSVSVVRFSVDGLKRDRDQVIAARSSFNFGIDAWDATVSKEGDDLPDGKFFTWLGQFQWVKQQDKPFFKMEWPKKGRIIFRLDAQWAKDELLPLEKFSIGGVSTVRGYRENQLTNDSGAVASLEYRISLTRLPLNFLSSDPEDGWLQMAFFYDYGKTQGAGNAPNSDGEKIHSLGLGLLWDPSEKFHTQLYWGHALSDKEPQQDKDLQDDGIHFEISAKY